MAYSASSTAPLIFYPNIAGQLLNYDFETALGGFGAGLDWGDDASTSTVPTRITTDFKSGIACLKLAPAVGALTSAVKHRTTLTAKYKKEGSASFYLYFYAKFVSGAGLATLDGDIRFTDGGGSTVGSAIRTSFLSTNSQANMTDNDWHWLRVGPLAAPTDWTTVTNLEVRFSAASTLGGGCEWHVDYVYAGHVLDFEDIGIAAVGQTSRCDIVHPYKYRKQVFCDYDENEYGAFSSRRYNTGFYTGEFETTGFPESARTSWQNFADYGMDGTAWTLWHDRTRVDRDYFAKVMTDQDHYGTEQLPGKLDWKAKMKWRQVIA